MFMTVRGIKIHLYFLSTQKFMAALFNLYSRLTDSNTDFSLNSVPRYFCNTFFYVDCDILSIIYGFAFEYNVVNSKTVNKYFFIHFKNKFMLGIYFSLEHFLSSTMILILLKFCMELIPY